MYYILILIYLATLTASSFDLAIEAYKANNQEVALEEILSLISEDDSKHEYYNLAAKIYYSIGMMKL